MVMLGVVNRFLGTVVSSVYIKPGGIVIEVSVVLAEYHVIDGSVILLEPNLGGMLMIQMTEQEVVSENIK